MHRLTIPYYSGMGDGLSINLDRQIKGGCI